VDLASDVPLTQWVRRYTAAIQIMLSSAYGEYRELPEDHK
jgi:hypothetical protein